MHKLTKVILVALLVLAGAVLLTRDAAAQPPAPTRFYLSKFEVASVPAAPFDLVEVALDFAPGAFTPPHTHGGQAFVTVIEGEFTIRQGGTDTKITAGQTVVEPNVVHEGGNTASANTRIVVTFLLPKGAAPTTNVPTATPTAVPTATPTAPAPTRLYLSKFEVASHPPVPFDLVQAGFDFPPGSSVAPHTHPGQAFVTVLQGELTIRRQGTETKLTAGQTFAESPSVVHDFVGNTSGANTRFAVSFLLPKGAPTSTPVQAAPPPAPQAVPTAGGEPPLGQGTTLPLALVVGSVLVLGGGLLTALLVRRRRR